MIAPNPTYRQYESIPGSHLVRSEPKFALARPSAIAIYWDFENLHASLHDKKHGNGTYRSAPHGRYDVLVQLPVVMEYARSLGEVMINRAFADWTRFPQYRNQVLDFSLDLIQLFPRGRQAKNGADIRIVLDAMEDVSRLQHLSHVVIVGGDSDYVGLVQKLRPLGIFVAGIGVQGATNRHWAEACTEFRFYDVLVRNTVGNPSVAA